MNIKVEDNFNPLIFIFFIIFILSVFSKFSLSLGIYTALFLLSFTVFVFYFNNFKINFKYAFAPALLFLATILISYFFADYKYNVRNEIFLLFSAFSIYFLSGFLSEKEKRNVLFAPIIIGLWFFIYLAAVSFSSQTFRASFEQRQNIDAIICFLLAVFSLSFAFWESANKNRVYITFALFSAIIFTKSLFAITLASAIFASFLFCIKDKLKIKTFIALAPFVLIFTAGFYFLLKLKFFQNSFLVWKTALPIIKNHFFFGVGFGNYKLVSGFYGENPSIGANNMFLQILSENGIFGLIFFLLMLAVFLVSINKKLKISKDKILYLAVVFAVVTVLLYNFFVFSIWTATDILLLFFLLSFSIEKYGFTNRNKKINFYILLSLLSPLTIISGMPFYAEQKYEKAMSSLAGQNRQSAELELFNALRGDGLNSKYFNALSDIYLQHYQDSKQKEYLDFAVNLSENALKLNKYNDKYYYQLAWLYYFKGDKNLALKNIEEALKIEGDNSLYKQTRETIKAF